MKISFFGYYLVFINIIDGILSYIGLKLDLIEEVNMIMNWLYDQNPIYFLMIKMLLSLLLYLLVIFRKIPANSWIYMLLVFGAVVYTIILFFHGVWLYVAYASTGEGDYCIENNAYAV
ncbi:DUF5658 family protein [Metabacillus rhizolycopersici]|uniref:DUF5658 family protein n=1 Tax=Metabacillus rhizolycopersici TaxID=2875709 RepID=A0ABS7UNV7_9BACI|nr:DUF5658 family protein [Metabacillus rhizolycopersici]MBZ5749688.1 DUF5658 family protein [Metabacillus rhizolycopersici]